MPSATNRSYWRSGQFVDPEQLRGQGPSSSRTRVLTRSRLPLRPDGTLELPGTRTFATGDRPVSVATGDFNSDGQARSRDREPTANTVSVLRGNNDGTFASQQTVRDRYPAPLGGRGQLLNWDDAPDLVVANSLSNTVSVLFGNGDGTFQPRKQVYPVSTSPAALTLTDLDGDGRLDLAVANAGSGRVSVLRGKLDGTFEATAAFLTDANPTAVLAANVMGSGAADLLTANTSASSVSVLVNVSDPPPPPPPVPTTGAASSVTAHVGGA